jgi:hypothetical protein
MSEEQDPRVTVRFGRLADAPASAALLIEHAAATADQRPTSAAVAHFSLPATSHALGCACCLPRGPVSLALGRLFLARARGEAPLFDTVVAVTRSAAGRAAVCAALEADVLTRARFRLAPDQRPARSAS